MLVYITPLSMFPELHSDRLFGSILYAVSELFPSKLENIINKFENNNPPFLISSAFPVLNLENKKLKFFPKIISNEKIDSKININIIKDFQNVKYVDENIFYKLLNGDIHERDILNDYSNYTRIHNLLMEDNHKKEIEIKNSISSHVTINRLTNKSKIYYKEGFVYGENVSLFFMIRLFDESYKNILLSALKFLKDRGLGKDISSGKGQFDYDIEEDNLFKNDYIKSGDRFINLSRFIPSGDDLRHIDENSSYELESKRSIDKSGDIRKQVHFFKEGSCFTYYLRYSGRIVNVGCSKPAIEYGYAFAMKYDGGI